MAFPCTHPTFIYKGRPHTEAELRAVLKNMDVATAAKYIPDVQSMPKMPFPKSWQEVAFKRVLRYAVENGFERVTWDTGETQAERYDLSKQVERINVEATDTDGVYFVDISPTDGDTIYLEIEDGKVRSSATGTKGTDELGLTGKPLDDVIGKEMAQKILDVPQGELAEFSGNDLKVGGEGMRGFYDRMLPSFVEKYAKTLERKGRDSLSKTPEGQAIIMYSDGRSLRSIASELGVDHKTVGRWLDKNNIQRPSYRKDAALKALAVRLYKDGDSQRSIAEQLKVSQAAIGHWLREVDEESRFQPYQEAEQAEMIRLYTEEGLSANDVADKLGVPTASVMKILRKKGSTRSRSEAASLRLETKPDSHRNAGRGKSSPYFSDKNQAWEFADSMLEVARMFQLDADPQVKAWTKKTERVPYGEGKMYVPDFLIDYVDGTRVVEEVKPSHYENSITVQAKASAAKKHFGDKGIEYRITTEKDIGWRYHDEIDSEKVADFAKKWGGKVERGSLTDTTHDGEKLDPNVDWSSVRLIGKEGRYWVAANSDESVRRTFETKAQAEYWVERIKNHYIPAQAPTAVHSLDITPAMRESVMQGQPLFKKAEEGDKEYLTNLQTAHTEDLTTNAVSKFTDGNLELSEEAGELLRRLEGVGAFYGATYTQKQLVKLANEADKWIKTYEDLGYSENQIKGLTQLAENLRELAKQKVGIGYVFDESLPEETHHKMALELLDGKKFKDYSKFKEFSVWNDPLIKRLYPKANDFVRAMEIAAKLETGQIESPDKDAFLQVFADGIIDAVGPIPETAFYDRILRYANTPTSDTGRSSEIEGSRSTEGPRTQESEGTRDRNTGAEESDGSRTAEEPGNPASDKPRNERERKVASFSRILGQDYFYDPQSHEDTEIRAAQLISDKGTQEAIYEALNGTPSAEGMRVVYWELERLTGALDNALAEGNEAEAAAYAEAAADLSAKIVQRQVAGGQETEIAKMLLPLSPESALLTAQKMIEYTKGEGAKLTPDQTKKVLALAKELKDARADIAKQNQKVKSLERRIDKLKEDRPRTHTAKMLRQYQKRKPSLIKELQDLFPEASVFNGETYANQIVGNDSFQMAAQGLTNEQQNKLTEYAAGEILENKPYETLISELNDFTGDEELSKQVHADAVESLRSERGTISKEAKEHLKIRNEHYREADKILRPKSENQNVKPVIDPNFKKLNDQNVRELSRVAQRVWAKTADPILTLAVERLNTDPKTINDVIKDVQKANPDMSIAEATQVVRKAKQTLTQTKAEIAEERDKLRGILPEQRKELQAARVAKQKATMKLNKFLASLADDSNGIKRLNNDTRAKFVLSWGTQLFNVLQSFPTNGAEAMIDLFTAIMKATGLNIGWTPDITAKDVLLPMSYIFANNRQMAEFALAEFPEQFFAVHSGLLGDIDIEPVNLADTKTNIISKGIHKWFDMNQRLNNKLTQITGAKLQEMHFRNAMVAGTFDQIIRQKSKGKETLKSAIENGTVTQFITEQEAEYAAKKALRVTYAAMIDDKMGKWLKHHYDKLDSFVPIFLNPVTYARFTYTTTKVMVANPILFGALDSQALGGPGYTTRSLASGILAWAGIAMAYGLMANFGGDDDEWYTLKAGDTYFDIRRAFPISAYFYMAHLIKNFKEGKPAPELKDLLEGFASLETDYFRYGAGLELKDSIVGAYSGTKDASDVKSSSARLMGNFFAGYLRFFKPMKDVLAQFDEEENKLRFYNNSSQDKFVKEISTTLPFVAQAYNAEKQKDALGNEIGMPFPAGRMFGIRIVHPSFLTPERSTATDWALRLFRYEGGGGEMTAEARKAYQMRRTIKNAIRRGVPKEDVQNQLQAYQQEFGNRSFRRLKDELSMSELAAQIKYNFGVNDKQDVESLRKVWKYATDVEKADLKKVLRAKKGRTSEFDREFGLQER